MDDKAIVAEVLSGNTNAFIELIDRHKRLVSHMVGRIVKNDLDREELCQDVFVKVFHKLGSFKFDSKLSTWIATIAYRMTINYLKKHKKKEQEVDLDQVRFTVSYEPNDFEGKDFANFVHHLIEQLPLPYRTVITLYYLDGLSYQEIVEITGMPEGTVKNYLFRARNKLKEISIPYLEKEIS